MENLVAELDYEAEETAILNAARQGIDLLVEDSGDPARASPASATAIKAAAKARRPSGS
jgi:hypothetical protein